MGVQSTASMNRALSLAFEREIALAKELLARGELERSLVPLARAHVLGQAFVVPHARTHWWMLEVEFRRKRPGAVIGQAVRIALGVLGSLVGIVPVGNTGRSDVGMFEPMPIAPELQRILDGEAPPDSRA